MNENNGLYSRSNVFNSFAWKMLERLTSLVVSLMLSVVLARLLDPADFGLMALINVFVAVSTVFVTSGPSNALVQKKDVDDLDYSSMFWFNLGVSSILYLALFLAAPFICQYLGYPEMIPMLRVLGIVLFFHAFNAIQCAYISKYMLFRFYFYSTLSGKVVSGILGVALALLGAGVWSLVWQSVSLIAIQAVILWLRVKWRPSAVFSLARIKPLVLYSVNIVATDLLSQLQVQLTNFVIGKKYTSSDLAYYSKGNELPNVLMTNASTSLLSVLFPVLADAQDDEQRGQMLLRRWIKLYAYCAFPILALLVVAAEPTVTILYSEKWLMAVPFLQIGCFTYAVWVVEVPIRESIKAHGFAGAVLLMQIVKAVVFAVIILCAVGHGALGIALGMLLSGVANFAISIGFSWRLLKYSPWLVCKDIGASLLLTFGVACLVAPLGAFFESEWFILIFQLFAGTVLYLLGSLLLRLEAFSYLRSALRERSGSGK